MNTSDPGSLQNLNDIVMPATVAVWPLATGWYVLIAISLLMLVWFIITRVRNWKANHYRRFALSELHSLSESIKNPAKRDAGLRTLPVLLKRTALSAYPRANVASLSGPEWCQFLNSKVKKASFSRPTFDTLELISYSTGGLETVSDEAAKAVINASESWLSKHLEADSVRHGRGA